MPKGDNPNSRANLRPFQAGLPEKAQREIQKKGSDAGNKAQAVRRSYYDVANELVTDEDRMAQIEVLKRMAENGDLKALELLLKVLKEYENKISVEASMVYEIVIDDEDEAAY